MNKAMGSKVNDKFMGSIVLILVISTFFQMGWSRHIAYTQLAKMTESMLQYKPEMKQEWMLIIKQADGLKNQNMGEKLLKQYGYLKQGVKVDGNGGIIAITLVMGGAILGTYCIQRKKEEKRITKRIDELIEYIKLAQEDKASSLLINREDEFSLLQDEIYKTITALYQTRKNALKDKEVLKEHIANIAHQLKTPLTSIGMMCELIGETAIEEEAQIYLTQLQNQLGRMNQWVHDLLLLAKLEANVVQMESKPIEVYPLMLRVLELLEPIAKKKNQQIKILCNEKEVSFVGDMKWSIEAFSNLVKNCIEHTPKDKTIMISYHETPLYCLVKIEDEGEGFELEDMPHLFERFYKGKNAAKGSIGIGLALAKTIIEEQNGYIEAENRKEGGARFTIKFYPSKK